MPTDTEAEDTLIVRTEPIEGYVKLISLNVGDEFETESTGGTVAWTIKNGHAQAVGVIFDGHTTDISIAPSMLVKIRKLAPIPAEKTIDEATQQIIDLAKDLSEQIKQHEALQAEQALFDDAAYAPLYPEAGPKEIDVRVRFDSKPQLMPHQQRVVEKCTAAPPTIKIIQLAEPEPVAKTTTVDSNLPVCKFDLTLNEQEISLLHFSSATDLFCRGLYFSWTKPTFFSAAKKHFPNLKCGQDYEACMRQIALYRATLRKAGKLG